MEGLAHGSLVHTMKLPFLTFALLPFVLTSLFTVRAQTTWMVPSPAAQTITMGIQNASPGDTVLVLPGTYRERISFGGKDIVLTSSAGAQATVLDGEGVGTVVTLAQGESRNAILRGFTITGGRGSRGPQGTGGGGLFVAQAMPLVEECTFRDNLAADSMAAGGHGGGAFCLNAAPLFRDCRFEANIAGRGPLDGGRGGACYLEGGNANFLRCTFLGNRGGDAMRSLAVNRGDGGDGGAVLIEGPGSIRFEDCLFQGNVTGRGDDSDGGGGGAGGGLCVSNATVTLLRCSFVENRGAFGGDNVGGAAGAVIFKDATGTVRDCVFARNRSGDSDRWAGDGSALYFNRASLDLINCLIVSNVAGDATRFSYGIGGVSAITVLRGSLPRFIHCTIANNRAGLGGSPGQGGTCGGFFIDPPSQGMAIENSILAFNPPRSIEGAANVRTSLVEDGSGTPWPGPGNVTGDPRFLDPPGGDFRPDLLSPAIGTGASNTQPAPATDLVGNPRRVGAPDLGCYERQPSSQNYRNPGSHPRETLTLDVNAPRETLELSGAAGLAPGFLMLAPAPALDIWIQGTPFYLSPSGFLEIIPLTFSPAGQSATSIPLREPALVGLRFFAQGLELTGLPNDPLRHSPGLVVLFGS